MPNPNNPLLDLQKALVRKITNGGGLPISTRHQPRGGLTMPPVIEDSDTGSSGGDGRFFTPGLSAAGGPDPLYPGE